METASSHSKEGEDRLSELCDDVLLSILQLLDLRTLVGVAALSRRWRHLPRLLPDITINAWDLPGRRHSTCEADQIVAAYTAAARWLLLPSTPRRSIRSIKLGFYLTDPYLRIIGDLVGDVVRSGGATQRLELVIPRFASFFDACPTAFGCLTHLTLEDLSFGDDVPALLTTCKKLRSLSLRSCDFGLNSVMEIDTPHSELVYLRLDSCSYGRIRSDPCPEAGATNPTERVVVECKSLSILYLNFRDQMVQGFVVEKKVMRYVRLVIQHSASLKRIRLLKQAPCEKCAAFNRRCILPETKWRFPEQKRDKVWCRDGLMEGQWSSAEIFIEE
uniref:F-box domain-containing protein n=1 Tax=Setaria viridis TaxID=4556 RepID=A0A4U6VD98_SETVI|nr:hypothetical protein SEVIR_3G205500v2 [Setaria viridis]